MKRVFNSVAAAVDAVTTQGYGFTFFDLGVDDATLRDMQSLKICRSGSYDNFGAPDCFEVDAARFFESLSNDPTVAARSAKIVGEILKNALSASGAEAAWVTLRAFTPTHEYDTPRWHRDGYFFSPESEGVQFKIAAGLKGAPTLFNDFPDNLRSKFNSLLMSFREDTVENREHIAELVDESKTVTPAPGQGCVFEVGSNRAGVHSEPPIHEERLFMSIVPGTAQQIAELRARWERPVATYRSANSL